MTTEVLTHEQAGQDLYDGLVAGMEGGGSVYGWGTEAYLYERPAGGGDPTAIIALSSFVKQLISMREGVVLGAEFDEEVAAVTQATKEAAKRETVK